MPGNSGKARAFGFLIYPDSWPHWKKDLESLHMPVIVSPVHDRDVFEEDDEEAGVIAGELKKAHHHGIVSWGNPTTLKNALKTLAPFGVTYVEPIASFAGYCRYLCHMDDPAKAQYDRNDVVCLGGAVPDFERKLTNAEILAQRDRIIDWCVSHQICEYAELVDAARNEHPDWRQDVYGNTVFWRGYLGSKRHLVLSEKKGE